MPDANVSDSSNYEGFNMMRPLWLDEPETFLLPVSLTQITKL